MNFKQYLNEGYSNYKNLVQRVMEKLDKKIDKIYPKGSFTILLDPDKPKEGNTNITIKISPDVQSQVKRSGDYSYLISIDSSTNTKEEIYRSLAHELTHISQDQSNFHHYEIGKDIKNFKDVKKDNKKLKFKDYYMEVSHSQRETEKEAKLIGIFELLKRGFIKTAIDSLNWEEEYYNTFDNKTFIKKAFSYGVNKENLNKFKNEFKDDLDEWFNDIKKIKNNYSDCFRRYFKEKIHIIRMVGLDEEKYNKQMINFLKNVTPEQKKADWSTNWDFIDRQVKLLNNEIKNHTGIPNWILEYPTRGLNSYVKDHPNAKKETIQLINKELQYRKQFGEE